MIQIYKTFSRVKGHLPARLYIVVFALFGWVSSADYLSYSFLLNNWYLKHTVFILANCQILVYIQIDTNSMSYKDTDSPKQHEL